MNERRADALEQDPKDGFPQQNRLVYKNIDVTVLVDLLRTAVSLLAKQISSRTADKYQIYFHEAAEGAQ